MNWMKYLQLITAVQQTKKDNLNTHSHTHTHKIIHPKNQNIRPSTSHNNVQSLDTSPQSTDILSIQRLSQTHKASHSPHNVKLTVFNQTVEGQENE